MIGGINYLHCPAAQDVAGTHQNRISDLLGSAHNFVHRTPDAVTGPVYVQLIQDAAKLFPILSQIDILRRGTENGYAGGLQFQGYSQGSLATELDQYAFRLFPLNNVKHILESHRFEVQPVHHIKVR